jgi:hypothetical protein
MPCLRKCFLRPLVGSKHMATLTNFSEYYKTISNSELLQIVENPHDYQPNAVEAAKHEFAARQLSEIGIPTDVLIQSY